MTEQELAPALKHAPVALIVLNDGGDVLAANDAAIKMGFGIKDRISQFLPQVQDDFFAELTAAAPTKLWRVVFNGSEKLCHISRYSAANEHYCWLQDMSEQLALAEKLKLMKDPGIKQLRKINHQSSTALGYAELLDVIMDDREVLTAEKLTAVKQYQSEVRSSLQKIQQIAGQEMTDTVTEKHSILLVEGHAALNELISELLKTEGYKVTNFLDATSAIKFYTVNHHSIQIAIVDETQRCGDDLSLPDALRGINPELSVITLSSDTDGGSEHSIKKPVDFRQLLQAVQD